LPDHTLGAPHCTHQVLLNPPRRVSLRTEPAYSGGLVFKAHKLLYHTTPGSRVMKKERQLLRRSARSRKLWLGRVGFLDVAERGGLGAPHCTHEVSLNPLLRRRGRSRELWLGGVGLLDVGWAESVFSTTKGPYAGGAATAGNSGWAALVFCLLHTVHMKFY